MILVEIYVIHVVTQFQLWTVVGRVVGRAVVFNVGVLGNL